MTKLELQELVKKVLRDMKENPSTHYINGVEVTHDRKIKNRSGQIDFNRTVVLCSGND